MIAQGHGGVWVWGEGDHWKGLALKLMYIKLITCRLQKTEHITQHRIHNTEHITQNTEHRTQKTENRTQKTETHVHKITNVT
jgi:hypothetical protein